MAFPGSFSPPFSATPPLTQPNPPKEEKKKKAPFNKRKLRLYPQTLKFSQQAADQLSACPIDVDGPIPNTNDQMYHFQDEELMFRLNHKHNEEGLFIDDVLGFTRSWMRTLYAYPERQQADACIQVAIHCLDQLAQRRRNLNPEEQTVTRPPLSVSRDEWIAIYDAAVEKSE
jgi:hypothetical protein